MNCAVGALPRQPSCFSVRTPSALVAVSLKTMSSSEDSESDGVYDSSDEDCGDLDLSESEVSSDDEGSDTATTTIEGVR